MQLRHLFLYAHVMVTKINMAQNMCEYLFTNISKQIVQNLSSVKLRKEFILEISEPSPPY